MYMRSIYLVMSQTGTILSKAIKCVTGDEYNHISISFDESLNCMYSFGRKYADVPCIGALVEEHIGKGTYKKFSETICRVIEIQVDDSVYDAASYYVQDMINRQKNGCIEYRYNILGLIYGLYGKKRQSEIHYYCSEFVREVLSVAGCDCSDISYYTPRPVEFEILKDKYNGRLVYEGLLRNYPYKNVCTVKKLIA